MLVFRSLQLLLLVCTVVARAHHRPHDDDDDDDDDDNLLSSSWKHVQVPLLRKRHHGYSSHHGHHDKDDGTKSYTYKLEQDARDFVKDVAKWTQLIVGKDNYENLTLNYHFSVDTNDADSSRGACGDSNLHKLFPLWQEIMDNPRGAEFSTDAAQSLSWHPSWDCLRKHGYRGMNGGGGGGFDVFCGDKVLMKVGGGGGGGVTFLPKDNNDWEFLGGSAVSLNLLDGSLDITGRVTGPSSAELVKQWVPVLNDNDYPLEPYEKVKQLMKECAADSKLVVQGGGGGGWVEAHFDKTDVVGYGFGFELVPTSGMPEERTSNEGGMEEQAYTEDPLEEPERNEPEEPAEANEPTGTNEGSEMETNEQSEPEQTSEETHTDQELESEQTSVDTEMSPPEESTEEDEVGSKAEMKKTRKHENKIQAENIEQPGLEQASGETDISSPDEPTDADEATAKTAAAHEASDDTVIGEEVKSEDSDIDTDASEPEESVDSKLDSPDSPDAVDTESSESDLDNEPKTDESASENVDDNTSDTNETLQPEESTEADAEQTTTKSEKEARKHEKKSTRRVSETNVGFEEHTQKQEASLAREVSRQLGQHDFVPQMQDNVENGSREFHHSSLHSLEKLRIQSHAIQNRFMQAGISCNNNDCIGNNVFAIGLHDAEWYNPTMSLNTILHESYKSSTNQWTWIEILGMATVLVGILSMVELGRTMYRRRGYTSLPITYN